MGSGIAHSIVVRTSISVIFEHLGSLGAYPKPNIRFLAIMTRVKLGSGRHNKSKRRRKDSNQIDKKHKTYNTGDSPAVTDLSTNPAVTSLSRAERTGCRVL
jgi:hypothetical protein